MGNRGYTEAAQEALIKGLVETGNELLNPPSSVDQLLIVIQKMEILLSQVYQNGPLPVRSALSPVINALIRDELIRHTDQNVQVGVAACTNELIRITAPEYPYNDDLMREIFRLHMIALNQLLSSEAGTNYIRAYRIIATMACVRSCLIMLDLQLDEIVAEMFQIFLDKISANDPEMFSEMKTVMTLVIQESEDISLDLLRLLLSRVKIAHKNTSPLSWELARSVFESCAAKFQQYVRDVVREMSLNIDDYDKIIASLCQDTSVEVPIEADTVTENASAQFVTVGASGEGVSYLEGTSQAAQEDCTPQVNDESGNISKDENSLEAVNCSQQTVQPESNNARSDVEVEKNKEFVQPNTDIQVPRQRRGRKPNTLMKPEEGYEQPWLLGWSGSFRLSYHRNKTENKDKMDLDLLLEHGNANVASDSSQKEIDSVNEGSSHKRNRSEKKESTTNEDDVPEPTSKLREKILKSKRKVKNSNVPKKKTKKLAAGSNSLSVEKEQVKCSAINSEGKNENEIVSWKDELGDVMDKLVESPKSKSAEAKNPGNLDSEEEKESMEVRLSYGPELVNRRVMVWWPLDKTYYTGTVEAFFPVTKRHRIKYDDDEEEVLDMSEETWELFTENLPQKMQSCKKQEAGPPTPAKERAKSCGKRAKGKAGSSGKQHAASASKGEKQ